MKYLIFIIFLTFNLYADMGNCLSCHPKLAKNIETDSRHIAMKSCIECHAPSKSAALECGDKCFSCHSKADMNDEEIKEHKVFEECRECHINVVHDLFDTSKSFNQSQVESLQDFLIH